MVTIICKLLFAFVLPALANSPQLEWKGDLRTRLQVENTEAADSRKSTRLRVRFGTNIKIDETLWVEFRLATMPTNRSTNQVMGDSKEAGSPRRYLGLDLAYGEWKMFPSVKLQAGRIPQWQKRPGSSQVVLDEDLALEGYAFMGNLALNDSWNAFASAGSAMVRENFDSAVYGEDQTDNVLHIVDLGLVYKTEDLNFKIGTGFFNFVGIQNQSFANLASGGAPLGNTETAPGSGLVKNNFKPMRLYSELEFKAWDFKWTPFAERIVNFETVDANRAWWVGFGAAKGAWSTQLAYSEVESDAVPAVFTFSDFAAGQSDSRGLIFSLQYKLGTSVSLKWTQFANRQFPSTLNQQYVRSHLDLSATF